MSFQKQENASSVGAAIFQSSESFASGFSDRVRAIHEKFDQDKDGYLNFEELSSLQLTTSGAEMSRQQFAMVCNGLGCSLSQGLNMDSLRIVYAAQGSDVDGDYEKIFKKQEEADDDVIEVVDGGVDISPES